MLAGMLDNLEYQGQALALRAQRQQVLASNIANADTPGFQARDFDFASALRQALSGGAASPAKAVASSLGGPAAAAPGAVASTGTAAHPGHLPVAASLDGSGPRLAYRLPEQPSMDLNTVDLDRERANFADNAVRYEATLRFIDGGVRTMISAIRGE